MTHCSKRTKGNAELAAKGREPHTPTDAVKLLKSFQGTKFDQTIENPINQRNIIKKKKTEKTNTKKTANKK